MATLVAAPIAMAGNNYPCRFQIWVNHPLSAVFHNFLLRLLLPATFLPALTFLFASWLFAPHCHPSFFLVFQFHLPHLHQFWKLNCHHHGSFIIKGSSRVVGEALSKSLNHATKILSLSLSLSPDFFPRHPSSWLFAHEHPLPRPHLHPTGLPFPHLSYISNFFLILLKISFSQKKTSFIINSSAKFLISPSRPTFYHPASQSTWWWWTKLIESIYFWHVFFTSRRQQNWYIFV